MSNWTDEQKQELVTRYQEAEPTATNSIEIVKELAEEFNYQPNAVRMILTKAGVYIAKTAATATAAKATGDKPARVGKEAAHASLNEAITDAGQTPNSEIVDKLTGKAALYFAELIKAISA